jgi:hypothetical protein
MRTFGLGLAIALIVSTFSAGMATAADKAPDVPKELRAKGMAAAPALITSAGADCKLADARFVGDSVDAKTKAKSSLYEVACTGGEGLLILEGGGAAGSPPSTFTCMEAATPGPDGKPRGTQCILPGNLDPKSGLGAYIAKAGVVCTPDRVRALGHSATNVYFELACHEGGGGYILQTSSPPSADKAASASPCIMFDPSSNEHCELTDRGAQLAVVDALVAKSGKPCAVKDRSFVGATQAGTMLFEVACQDGKGYMLEEKSDGSLNAAVPCTEADSFAGGCKLTDSRQAKTEQSALYTSLAKKAGFDCNVSGYAPFAVNLNGKEVVELACSNRADGAVGVFPASASQTAEIYDCAHSELKSFRCSLNKPAAGFPKLTADLQAVGKSSCTVSEARTIGVSAEQQGYIEVGCSDGLPGFVIQYTMSPITPKTAILCAEASGINGGCTLPHNKK